jgi:hypothetical protein
MPDTCHVISALQCESGRNEEAWRLAGVHGPGLAQGAVVFRHTRWNLYNLRRFALAFH